MFYDRARVYSPRRWWQNWIKLGVFRGGSEGVASCCSFAEAVVLISLMALAFLALVFFSWV